MSCVISTGEAFSAPVNSSSPLGANGVKALFDNFSKSRTSRRFVVRPGKVVMLSGFNFYSGIAACVQKVRMPVGQMPMGYGCCVTEPHYDPAVPLSVEEITQCGVMCLDPCNNTLFLSIPGTFQLELNAMAAVGVVYVEATTLSAEEILSVPRELFFGAPSTQGNCVSCS